MKFQIVLEIEADEGKRPEVKVIAPAEFNKHGILQWCLFTAMSMNTLIELENDSKKIVIPDLTKNRALSCFPRS